MDTCLDDTTARRHTETGPNQSTASNNLAHTLDDLVSGEIFMAAGPNSSNSDTAALSRSNPLPHIDHNEILPSQLQFTRLRTLDLAPNEALAAIYIRLRHPHWFKTLDTTKRQWYERTILAHIENVLDEDLLSRCATQHANGVTPDLSAFTVKRRSSMQHISSAASKEQPLTHKQTQSQPVKIDDLETRLAALEATQVSLLDVLNKLTSSISKLTV